jgi:hypothetical protein
MGWPDNHVMCSEYFECAVQNRGREVWAVAIECEDMLLASGSEMSKNRGKSGSETFAFLRHYLHRIPQ